MKRKDNLYTPKDVIKLVGCSRTVFNTLMANKAIIPEVPSRTRNSTV